MRPAGRFLLGINDEAAKSVVEIFFAQTKGRVRKKLTVFSDGDDLLLRFLILARTNPSRAERAAGAKEKRIVVLEQTYRISHISLIDPYAYPLPELVAEFLSFREKGEKQS